MDDTLVLSELFSQQADVLDAVVTNDLIVLLVDLGEGFKVAQILNDDESDTQFMLIGTISATNGLVTSIDLFEE